MTDELDTVTILARTIAGLIPEHPAILQMTHPSELHALRAFRRAPRIRCTGLQAEMALSQAQRQSRGDE